MGAAESTEESGVLRFVDSVNIKHEKESTSCEQDFFSHRSGNAGL